MLTGCEAWRGRYWRCRPVASGAGRLLDGTPRSVVNSQSSIRRRDLDLLVVMSFEGSSFEKMLEIGMALGHGSIGTDIVVTRPEEFAWRKQIVGTIEYPAAREGKIVY